MYRNNTSSIPFDTLFFVLNTCPTTIKSVQRTKKKSNRQKFKSNGLKFMSDWHKFQSDRHNFLSNRIWKCKLILFTFGRKVIMLNESRDQFDINVSSLTDKYLSSTTVLIICTLVRHNYKCCCTISLKSAAIINPAIRVMHERWSKT